MIDKKVLLKRFYIIYILQCLAANYAHPCTPTIISNLGLHDYMFGVAFACMAFGTFIFSPFWGKLSDKIGRVKVLVICGIGYAVGQMMFGLATTELGIIIARAVAGCFTGGCYVCEISYLIDITTEETRGRHFNISVTFMSVFSAFGYLIGGFLGDISIDLMFVVQSLTLALSGILFGILLKDVEDKGFQKKINRNSFGSVIKESNPFSSLKLEKELMTKVVILFGAAALITAFGTTAYEQCFNYYIKDQLNFSPSYNGILKAILGFITLIVNFTIGLWILNKTNLKKSFSVTTFLCGISMILIIFTNDVKSFIIINVVVFALNAIYQPLIQTIYANSAENVDNGIMMGVFNSLRSFGNIIGALFSGFIYEFGPKLTFIFAGIAFMVIIIFVYMANNSSIKVTERKI